ncbi:hypothetical protein DENIS_0812 [Desulfonema ishimotonii]|uniref:Outer membrane protein assembly factor BamD n=1 Tax=Desulfonema ishimotonii TaxID=45657 RepID=A0A401FSC0_9BACT|nr:tetratricopeptide repeat protein [Desulfonema ishimotonii]GBC59871.1 hypothetical protein DENIS_0812 [Desulfonema ishimotonii]
MKRVFIFCLLWLALLTFGCSDKRAETLFETAELEELQNNPDHACQLYEELITTYPESKYARSARKRLDALGR